MGPLRILLTKKKVISLILGLMGILMTAYGMSRENNPCFIIGLALIVGGYMLIRREIKKDIQGHDN